VFETLKYVKPSLPLFILTDYTPSFTLLTLTDYTPLCKYKRKSRENLVPLKIEQGHKRHCYLLTTSLYNGK
jgi:hypothetical protein